MRVPFLAMIHLLRANKGYTEKTFRQKWYYQKVGMNKENINKPIRKKWEWKKSDEPLTRKRAIIDQTNLRVRESK